MTNERAIQLLTEAKEQLEELMRKKYGDAVLFIEDENVTALELAIDAIKKDPGNDGISRKEVIETIRWYDENTYDYINRLIESIERMEPVRAKMVEPQESEGIRNDT